MRIGWSQMDITPAVQYWMDNPGENFGVVIKAVYCSQQTTTYTMWSSNAVSGMEASRPQLVISYLPPAPTATPTRTPTQTLTPTQTHTPTRTHTPTPTFSRFYSATPTATTTPLPPTATNTPLPTNTNTPIPPAMMSESERKRRLSLTYSKSRLF